MLEPVAEPLSPTAAPGTSARAIDKDTLRELMQPNLWKWSSRVFCDWMVVVIPMLLAGYARHWTAYVLAVIAAPNIAGMGLFLALVLLEPDFGTVVLIAMVLLLMVFVGGAKPGHMLFSIAGLGGIGLWLVASQAYRMRRMMAFLDPWEDRLDSGFQIIQSYLAFGQGGFLGQGIGASRQKMFFLPDAHTDFIFSIVGEEMGLIGVLAAMALFACFLWRGFRVCLSAQEDFGRYLAYGITTLFALQMVLNLAVVMGMMPTKGLPLPFISKGGSSLLLTLFMVGGLLTVGRRAPATRTH